MRQYNLAIIGLGVNAKWYYKALQDNQTFRIVSTCDISFEAVARTWYSSHPFYTSMDTMLKQETIDLVLVATPPKTHYDIARKCIEQGVGVIVEKPAVLEMHHLEKLLALAKEKNVIFDCLFHWQHANEVTYVLTNHREIQLATSIRVEIYDPYTKEDQKTIQEDRLSLHGAWYDSGVNALSFLQCFLPLEDFKLVKKVEYMDKKNNLPYYSNHTFIRRYQRVQIIVNWRKKRFFKKTTIAYPNNVMTILHHNEEVYLNGKCIYQGNKENRMISHYANYFAQFNPNTISHKQIISIHKKLMN